MSGCGEEIQHACHASTVTPELRRVEQRKGSDGYNVDKIPKKVLYCRLSNTQDFDAGAERRQSGLLLTRKDALGTLTAAFSPVLIDPSSGDLSEQDGHWGSNQFQLLCTASTSCGRVMQARCFAKSVGILDMATPYVYSGAAEAVQPGSTAPSRSALVLPLLMLSWIPFFRRGMMERVRTDTATELGFLV